MRVYISGKIRGLDPAICSANFEKKEKELLISGYQVFNPVRSSKTYTTNETKTNLYRVYGICNSCAFELRWNLPT